MNSKKTTFVLSAAIMLSVASITGFQITEIIAEEDEDKGYTFGENVSITGYFHFPGDGDEMIPFQVFEQTAGWEKADPFTFDLIKVTGNTPLLHKYADLSQKYRNSIEEKKSNYAEFTVDVILSNNGDLKRTFAYEKCHIDAYYIDTLFDKEEGWNTSKGFSVIDTFEIECQSYQPNNPTYEEMAAGYDRASTKSTIAYNEEQRSFYRN